MRRLFKNKNIRKRYSEAIKKHQPKGIQEVKSVGVIVDKNCLGNLENLSLIKKAFQLKDGQLCWIFLETNKEVGEELYFDKKQINWKGEVLEGSDAYKFLSSPYDLLINYYQDSTSEILLLSAMVKASLKVGFSNGNQNANDLDIELNPQHTKEFMEEIKKYLSFIN